MIHIGENIIINEKLDEDGNIVIYDSWKFIRGKVIDYLKREDVIKLIHTLIDVCDLTADELNRV